MPDIDPDAIIDAADAEIVEADAYAHSAIGDIARHAQDMVQHSGIDFGPAPQVPPEVTAAAAQMGNPLHDLAERTSDLVHHVHDIMVEAVADDVHDAGPDAAGDHVEPADDHAPYHAPDTVDDHATDTSDT